MSGNVAVPVAEYPQGVRELNDAARAGIEIDSTTATGNLDLFADVNASVYVLTNNLSGAVSVGLNLRNARRGQRMRVVRDSATPGAFAVTVKSGTAAAGSAIGTIEASANGFIEAQFDGTAWKKVGDAAAA